MTSIRPVVLSGGSGTRLWPLSTHELPKQFVDLFSGRSLFDMTLARTAGIEGVGDPMVVTNAAYVGLAEEALIRSGASGYVILVEPVGRNTAPAAIAAALSVDPSDTLLIVPSDHLVANVAAFQEAVTRAVESAQEGSIVTFGIRPSRAETGYGYIELGEASGNGVFSVKSFKEKPDAATAEDMVADGQHFWNSGMFVARSDHLLAEAAEHCPDTLAGVRAALPAPAAAITELTDEFAAIEGQSIDYAIMEKTRKALVIPIDVGWDDIGSYQSLLTAVSHDQDGNHIEGDVVVDSVSGSFIRATSRTVAVSGVSDIVVVETPEAVLVIPVQRSQDVREIKRRVDDA